MKNCFNIGDVKLFNKVVNTDDIASFDSGTVHQVYATFALGRDAEWSSRLFVLEMKEDDEEGIGTFLNIQHQSPAKVGDMVTFTAEIYELQKNVINCNIVAKVGERVIATGSTGQKIIKKEKLEILFNSL